MLTVCSRIVVPYDASEHSKKALETAVAIAKQDERIELDVISIVNVRSAKYYGAYYNINAIREAELTVAKEALNAVEPNLSSIPNKTKTIVLEGSPAFTIIDYIKENDVDLVVMGSRGLSGIEEMFLGSVSHYVVQKSTCPVYIVK